MKQLIQDFSNHITESIKIGNSLTWSTTFKPKNVVISGLGGSGIGGTMVAQLVNSTSGIPVIINKGYTIPAFVNEDTLFIASSYSGNTEETLQALDLAIQAKAKVACLTSGGKILEIAKQHHFPYSIMPSGFPPRSAFGYSSTQLMYLLYKFSVINLDFEKQLQNVVELLHKNLANIQQEALQIAQKISNKLVVIYSEDQYEGVAIRFRQQINENSKNLCWHHVIPEMNHNELVGWTEMHTNIVPIFLRTQDEFERNTTRFEINKSIISKYVPEILEIHSKGDSMLERMYYLIHLTDWVSLYISEIKQIDVTEVKVIDYLKSELAKV